VHHEVQLSAFPLSIEWLPVQPTAIEAGTAERGNFAIVSSFLPEIEIWNLDIVNVLEPTVILGGEIE
jgi:periodic tryptophan protein 1